MTSSQTLWGVRNRHGKITRIYQSREAAEDAWVANNGFLHEFGGPWELVSGVIEWEAAE